MHYFWTISLERYLLESIWRLCLGILLVIFTHLMHPTSFLNLFSLGYGTCGIDNLFQVLFCYCWLIVGVFLNCLLHPRLDLGFYYLLIVVERRIETYTKVYPPIHLCCWIFGVLSLLSLIDTYFLGANLVVRVPFLLMCGALILLGVSWL